MNWCCAKCWAARAAGFPRVRVVERIGSMDSPRTISLIAIHAHGIPTVFPQTALDQAKAAQPLDAETMKTAPICAPFRSSPSIREDARDHDDAVWAGPDDEGRRP